MTKTFDDKDITKLPKWAQEYIKTLQNKLEITERAIAEMQDADTVSPISYECHYYIEGSRSPQFTTKYVQSTSIDIRHKGALLRVVVPPDDWMRLYVDTNISRGDVRTVLAPSASNAYEVMVTTREPQR